MMKRACHRAALVQRACITSLKRLYVIAAALDISSRCFLLKVSALRDDAALDMLCFLSGSCKKKKKKILEKLLDMLRCCTLLLKDDF